MSDLGGMVDVHIVWARALFAALASSGVTDVVVSPGSRSTPLVVAALSTEGLRVHSIVDERSAAFFALGQARVTARPSALVCTSGTALAHYYPAVIEASHARLPMIILSADRPFELHHAAAPQTIDQLDVFGRAVRHRAVLGVPESSAPALRALGRIGAQMVLSSLHPDPGPVHLDVPFRKPLEPSRPPSEIGRNAPSATEPSPGSAPRLFAPPLGVSDEAVRRLAEAALAAERGLVIAGPRAADGTDRLARAAARFAHRAGMPLLVEATSQLRRRPHGSGAMGDPCGFFEPILRHLERRSAVRPDLLVEIGATPTSAAYARCAGSETPRARFVLLEHGKADPHGTATDLVWGDPAALLERAADLLPEISAPSRGRWLEGWHRAEAAAAAAIDAAIPSSLWVEAAIGPALWRRLPEGAAVVLGNSSPVRDADAFTRPGGRSPLVLHQRGAAGIDGLVAGAAGAASAFDGPVVAWIGDVSALHDLGGFACLLEAQRRSGQPIAVVVVDNQGGRLFEQLPVAGSVEPEVFERFFLTPPGVDFERFAAALGLAFERAESVAAFDRALDVALSGERCVTVISAVVDPQESRAHRRATTEAVAAALDAIDFGVPTSGRGGS